MSSRFTPRHCTALHLIAFPKPRHEKGAKQAEKTGYYTTERVFTDSTFASPQLLPTLSPFLLHSLFSSRYSSTPSPPRFPRQKTNSDSNSNGLTDPFNNCHDQADYDQANYARLAVLHLSPNSHPLLTPPSSLYALKLTTQITPHPAAQGDPCRHRAQGSADARP
jgi:hypothetical protein